MGFHVLWIIVLAFAVFLLSVLFRSAEDGRKNQRQRPAGRPAPGPRNRSNETVNRFLEEINRRRNEAATRQASQTTQLPPTSTPTAKPRQPSRPIPSRPQTGGGSAPQFGQDLSQTVRRSTSQIEKSTTTALPEILLVDEIPQSDRASKLATPGPIVSARAPAIAAVVQTDAISPAAAQLVTLVRSRETLRAALILNEVLGEPRCRRRPGSAVRSTQS